MLSDLVALVNRNWDDKGDAGAMARIILLLYDGYTEPGRGYYKAGVYVTLDGEIQKMISESKNNIRKGKHLLPSREQIAKMFKDLGKAMSEQALRDY
jgi:hypothetical protein